MNREERLEEFEEKMIVPKPLEYLVDFEKMCIFVRDGYYWVGKKDLEMAIPLSDEIFDAMLEDFFNYANSKIKE